MLAVAVFNKFSMAISYSAVVAEAFSLISGNPAYFF